MSETTWIEYGTLAEFPGEPRWRRLVAVDDDGTVFVPAAMSGNEQKAVLLSAYDAVKCIERSGHFYLPTAFMVATFPDTLQACQAAEASVKRHLTSADAGAEAKGEA